MDAFWEKEYVAAMQLTLASVQAGGRSIFGIGLHPLQVDNRSVPPNWFQSDSSRFPAGLSKSLFSKRTPMRQTNGQLPSCLADSTFEVHFVWCLSSHQQRVNTSAEYLDHKLL